MSTSIDDSEETSSSRATEEEPPIKRRTRANAASHSSLESQTASLDLPSRRQAKRPRSGSLSREHGGFPDHWRIPIQSITSAGYHLKTENFGGKLCLVLEAESGNIVCYCGSQSLTVAFPMFYIDPRTITNVLYHDCYYLRALRLRFEMDEMSHVLGTEREVEIVIPSIVEYRDLLDKCQLEGVACTVSVEYVFIPHGQITNNFCADLDTVIPSNRRLGADSKKQRGRQYIGRRRQGCWSLSITLLGD